MKKLIWFTPIVLLLLTQFNNCSPYTQPDSSELSSLGDLACDTDCITPNAVNLTVKPNIFTGNYQVPSRVADFNIAGDCNEGGYAYNVITWELYDVNNAKVRTSSMTGANTACVNGRFMAYIRLDNISPDPIDRTGLKNAQGTRQQYTLKFQIFGRLTQNGALQLGTDPIRNVPLVPL